MSLTRRLVMLSPHPPSLNPSHVKSNPTPQEGDRGGEGWKTMSIMRSCREPWKTSSAKSGGGNMRRLICFLAAKGFTCGRNNRVPSVTLRAELRPWVDPKSF